MKARRIKCAHCGANLNIDVSAGTVTCAFCGTTSALEGAGKKNKPARPVPPSDPRPGKGWELTARLRMPFFIGLPLFIWFMVGGLPLARTLPGMGRALAGMSMWQGHEDSPLLLDLHGDGTLELVGRTRNVGAGDSVTLSAFDGTSGKRLWESPPIGTYSDTYRRPLAVADALLLATNEQGQVFGIRRGDGTQAFAVSLGEVVKSFCRGEGGVLVALTAEGNRRALDPVSGTASFLNRESPCEPLTRDTAGGFVARRRELLRKLPRVSGMSVEGALNVDTAQFVVGTRSPGTELPVAARLEGRSVVWLALLPEHPMQARDDGPPLALATGDGVFAVYEKRDNSARLVRLNLADGGRVWDVEIPAGMMPFWESITASRTHVYLSGSGRLDAFDLRTGAHAFRLGR